MYVIEMIHVPGPASSISKIEVHIEQFRIRTPPKRASPFLRTTNRADQSSCRKHCNLSIEEN